ncbi:RNA polymerase sigma factor [uncultured Butyricimonas sp.]|uniref:RNA polymerase sigma factor n=1 Tax=uncultured Butyricimonas sp. TaxID=1268785 RepID=UPI0026DD37EB|nr:sigma-70 family RNA polymerase sigma factor [uncultured Butyricimonas sp.]
MDEAWVIEECRKGNPKAQKSLYEYFAPRMMGVCIRYAGNRDAAGDLLQDGFVKVFTRLNEYMAVGSFEGWMRKIFINCALERIRKERIFSRVVEGEIDVEDTIPSVLETLTEMEMLQMIRLLSEGYRTVFNLFAIEGFSHKEIGEMLHITEGTSRSQYARARQCLQEMIRKMY